MKTLRQLLEDYILSRDLNGGSPDWYRRVVGVVETWHGSPVTMKVFTVDFCNRFLLAKKDAGRSSHYRKGLRATLRALLNHAGIPGKLRPVKFEQLYPQAWSAEEVGRLVAAAPSLEWQVRINCAYISGLNVVDLEKVTKADIVDGVLKWKRSKTGKLVLIRFPDWLVAQLPSEGPICPRSVCYEWVRKQFAAIVLKAGLTGGFKTLRKSSGTSVELIHPGCGHLHLGNTRAVFEKHYLNPERGLTAMTPVNVGAPPPAATEDLLAAEWL